VLDRRFIFHAAGHGSAEAKAQSQGRGVGVWAYGERYALLNFGERFTKRRV